MQELTIKTAKIISTLLNPFFLFAPLQLLYFYLTSNLQQSTEILIWNTLLQAVFPFILILVFMKLKLVSDFDISDKNERTLYFSIITVLFIISSIISQDIQAIFLINVSLSISLILIIVINFYWKISEHTTLDTVLVLGLILINPMLLPLFLLIPLVAWSRIVLNKHLFTQTVAGMILGCLNFFLVTLILF